MKIISKKLVLDSIKPSKREHEAFTREVLVFLTKLREASLSLKIESDFFVGGSFGKETYLKGDFDVDIFCNFDKNYPETELSNLAKKILDSINVISKKNKGSRDYFSGVYGSKIKFNFELIPNKKIQNPRNTQNSTDLSCMHVLYLRKKVENNPNLCDEIRLAKQFFKAQGLYGAESYIQGFSGHVLDILIMNYGSLENLLEEAKKWGEQTIIDINSIYKDKETLLRTIGKEKSSSLVLVDPIIENRNAARALSTENYSKFLVLAYSLDKIDESYFEIKKRNIKLEVIKARKFAEKNNLFFLCYKILFSLESYSEDIAGSKLLRLSRQLESYFNENDFKVFKRDFQVDMVKCECYFIFIFEFASLPKIKVIKGPKVSMRDALKSFISKREKYFVEEDRLYSYEKRKYTNLESISIITKKSIEKFISSSVDFIKTFEKM